MNWLLTFHKTSCLLSSCQASATMLCAPPGGEVLGHCCRTSTLLLRTSVHLCHQRAGAGKTSRVQLRCRSVWAAQLLQPAATHSPGGDRWELHHRWTQILLIILSRVFASPAALSAVFNIQSVLDFRWNSVPTALRNSMFTRMSELTYCTQVPTLTKWWHHN